MFEQEIELEKHQSSTVPLLLIVALILGVVGLAGYHVIQSRKVLSVPEAANVVIDVLKAQGPATVGFHTGMLVANVADNPRGPHYRLLEKAAIVKIGKDKGVALPVELTPKGGELLKQISGVKTFQEKGGTQAYVVPLAERRLLEVSKVVMTGTGRATVEFTWEWKPNALGESFDAAGAPVKSFNMWDRATLIEKYGAQFYHQPPTRVVIAVVKTDKGWQPSIE